MITRTVRLGAFQVGDTLQRRTEGAGWIFHSPLDSRDNVLTASALIRRHPSVYRVVRETADPAIVARSVASWVRPTQAERIASAFA